MKIMIVGTGYVGLTVGIGFAELGHEVVCYDKDAEKIARLSQNLLPIYEEDMEALVYKNQDSISFTASLLPALSQISVLFLTIGTPSREDGTVDMSDLFQAVMQIGAVLEKPVLIINKSTSPPGTAQKIKETLNQILSDRGCDFVCRVITNPEFLHEGKALSDFFNPDRIIVGTDSEAGIPEINQLFSRHIKNGTPILYTDTRASELLKYVNNAVAALKVSFINEIANICENEHINVWEVIRLLTYDKRVSPQYLSPGIGFGGSCLPKDLKALEQIAANADVPLVMTNKIIEANLQQAQITVSTIRAYLPKGQLTILGTAFKPGTNDTRESPSIRIIRSLLNTGDYLLHIYDPQALEHTKEDLDIYAANIRYFHNLYEACDDSSAVAILTGWSQFAQLDLERIKHGMKYPLMLDFHNIVGKDALDKSGFRYYIRGIADKGGAV